MEGSRGSDSGQDQRLEQAARAAGVPALMHDAGERISWPRQVLELARSIGAALDRPKGAVRTAVQEIPFLFVVLFVLFVTGEAWQLADRTPPERLAVLIVVLGAGILVLLLRATNADRAALVHVTEMSGDASASTTTTTTPARVSRAARRQISAVLVIDLLVYVVAVAAATFALFVVIGALALTTDLQEIYIGRPPTTLLARQLGLTVELLSLSALLGALAGLSFTVQLAREPDLRARLLAGQDAHIRAALMLWRSRAGDLDEGRGPR